MKGLVLRRSAGPFVLRPSIGDCFDLDFPMATDLDLTPSLEKIARAQRKFDQLLQILNEWHSILTYEIRRELHDEVVHVIVRVNDLPPQDVPFEIVESVGHLRSALDKMLVALAERNGSGTSRVGFPFGGNAPGEGRDAFLGKPHADLQKKLTPKQWKHVLAQEPYPGGNDLLWTVNQIANEDKHRRNLVGVYVQASPQSLSVRGARLVGSQTVSARKLGSAIRLGAHPDFNIYLADKERESILMSYVHGPGSTHPEIEPKLAALVVFGNIPGVAGDEVMSTLSAQVSLVKGIVEDFAKTFS